jgi:hypothetical protein
MALTTDQIKLMRRWVGRRPDDAALQDGYDRLGSLTETVREVLQTRRADLIADPASYSVPGEYSQDTRANLEAIDRLLAELGDLDSPETDDDAGLPLVQVNLPARGRVR